MNFVFFSSVCSFVYFFSQLEPEKTYAQYVELAFSRKSKKKTIQLLLLSLYGAGLNVKCVNINLVYNSEKKASIPPPCSCRRSTNASARAYSHILSTQITQKQWNVLWIRIMLIFAFEIWNKYDLFNKSEREARQEFGDVPPLNIGILLLSV